MGPLWITLCKIFQLFSDSDYSEKQFEADLFNLACIGCLTQLLFNAQIGFLSATIFTSGTSKHARLLETQSSWASIQS